MSTRPELEKLTTTKLKEVAKEYPDIVGATGMKKLELIVAILQARGEPVDDLVKDAKKIAELKKQIRKLKVDRDKALEDKDAGNLKKTRKQIKQLVRKTRVLAQAH
ncbi:MAG: transcription termination factor Rho [Deltaproteobacteria bacterium]|nr:transcription termination factor Rho [Deltaproteobacteria bacterium]